MYRYIRGLFSNAVYITIAPGTAFVTPPDSGPLAILTGCTNIKSFNLNRYHAEACKEHQEWVNLQRARKKQIAESVTKTFLEGVFDRNRGFAHIRVRDIIAYFFTDCGRL